MTRRTADRSDDAPAVHAPEPLPRRRLPPWVLAVIVAIVLIVGGITVLLVDAGRSDPGHGEMPGQAATVQLADLPPASADLYRYAAAHAAHFAQIPCYCGCDRSLSHDNLTDCFVTADGDWDAHGSTCGICTAEAIQARTELDGGTPIRTVGEHIISQFANANPANNWSPT